MAINHYIKFIFMILLVNLIYVFGQSKHITNLQQSAKYVLKYPCLRTEFVKDQLILIGNDTVCYLKYFFHEDSWVSSYFIIETFEETDYIKSTIEAFCRVEGTKVAVIDHRSDNVLSLFDDLTLGQKNLFISDSNKIRIEFPGFFDLKSFAKVQDNQLELKLVENNTIVFHLKMEFSKISFNHYFNSSRMLETFVIDSYEPNSVWTFVINKDPNEKTNEYKIGVVVEIEQLDLDFNKDDYLIIGPGEKPEFWVHSKCQMVTKKISDPKEKMTFWINADSAFIRVVTHNSLKRTVDNVLVVNYQEANKTIHRRDDDDIPNRIKAASMQMCFYISCILWKTNVKEEFVEEFVYHLNNYLIEHESNVSMLINKESIKIFDEETQMIRNEETCRISIVVTSPYDPEYPLLDQESLHKMYFGNSHSRMILHDAYFVNDCVYQTITYLKILIPILGIVLISSTITLFFWKIQSRLISTKIKYNNNNIIYDELPK